MKLVGHQTEAIYRRYAIVAPQDLADGVKRHGVSEFLAQFRHGESGDQGSDIDRKVEPGERG